MRIKCYTCMLHMFLTPHYRGVWGVACTYRATLQAFELWGIFLENFLKNPKGTLAIYMRFINTGIYLTEVDLVSPIIHYFSYTFFFLGAVLFYIIQCAESINNLANSLMRSCVQIYILVGIVLSSNSFPLHYPHCQTDCLCLLWLS